MAGSGVRVRVDKFLGGMTIPDNSVVGNIYAVDPKQGKNSLRNVAVPIGPAGTPPKDFSLPEGHYLVEAVLPSGDILSQEASVKKDSWANVDLRAEQSAHEWHSWQNLLGNVPAYESYYRFSSKEVRAPVAVWDIRNPAPELSGLSPGSVWSFLHGIMDQAEARDFEGALARISPLAAASPVQADATSQLYQYFTGMPAWTLHEYFAPTPVPVPPRLLPRWYACVQSENGFELVSLPVPWIDLRNGGEVPVELLVQQRPGGVLEVGFSVLDGDFGTALGYMARGSLQSALQLAARNSALDMLFAKFENPLGAAAGGYLLLGTEPVEKEKPWHQWIRNLNKYFPWLPDGAVLDAWMSLRQGANRENLDNAFRCLTEAYRRGLPYFSFGLQWMVDGLTLVTDVYPEAVNEMLSSVQRIAWRVNTLQPFTSLALARPTSSRGNPFNLRVESRSGNAVKPVRVPATASVTR